MKAFDGYKAEISSPADKLPVGNYVVRIIGAEELEYSWGNVLAIKFDINEGEWKNYYTNRYNNQQGRNENYKGVYRLNIPVGDHSDRDKWYIHRFNNTMGVLEKDNPKFKWNWDISKLTGLKCGMVFRSREWAYDGQTGFYAEPYSIVSIDSLPFVKTPAPKYLSTEKKREYSVSPDIDTDVSDGFAAVDNSRGDLPF